MIDGAIIRASLGVKGSVPYFAKYNRYILARVSLLRSGCPAELRRDQRVARLHLGPQVPVVIERNRQKLGYVAATGYYPGSIVVAGTQKRADLLQSGTVRGWAWVECGALEIRADDAISSEELLAKLQQQLNARYVKPGLGGLTEQPWIVHLYPFENYCIVCYKGQKYRQPYTVNPVAREVALAGQPQAVKEQYVNALAPRDVMASACSVWSDSRVGVSRYLSDLKTGLYRPLPNNGLSITAGRVTGKLRYTDFALWALTQQNKKFKKLLANASGKVA